MTIDATALFLLLMPCFLCATGGSMPLLAGEDLGRPGLGWCGFLAVFASALAMGWPGALTAALAATAVIHRLASHESQAAATSAARDEEIVALALARYEGRPAEMPLAA